VVSSKNAQALRAKSSRPLGAATVMALAGLASLTGSAEEAAAAPPATVASQPGWDFAGQNLADTHYAATEHTIGAGNVACSA